MSDTNTAPDVYRSGGNRHPQIALDHSWRELREPLQRAILAATSAITALRDLPRADCLNERPTQRKAISAFAEHLSGNLDDLLNDVLGPLHRRADEAGIMPELYSVDRVDFDAAVSAATKEG